MLACVSFVLVLASTVWGNATATTNTSGCSDNLLFSLQPTFSLGPISMRTFIKDTTLCAQVIFPNAATVRWVSVGFSLTKYMVNTPVSNVVVFDVTTALMKQYLMKSYDSVPLQPGLPSIVQIHGSVAADGLLSFTFERPLVATTPYDIALDPAGVTQMIWGYALGQWPTKHVAFGDVQVLLGASQINDEGITYTSSTPMIVVIAFGVMVTLGLLAAYVNPWHRWSRVILIAPSKRVSMFYTDPFNVGEAAVVLVYVGGAIAICWIVHVQFNDHPPLHQWCLALGHLALQALASLLLPVARGHHWELAFGTSYERLLKFHRWLGLFCVATSGGHLVLNMVNGVNTTSSATYGTLQVVPLYGLLAFVAFASMTVLAWEPIRRSMYEVFYYYHRVASVVGLVFILLHCPTVQYTLICPLIAYGISAVGRIVAFWNRHEAVVTIDDSSSVLVTLPTSAQTTKWATQANPCSFFWVNVPSISLLEWHPFTAIVTRDGKSIAFCMKSMGAGGFVDRVVRHAATTPTLSLLVGGPYGKPSIHLTQYDVLVLVAGGVGITPMLNVINRHRHQPGRQILHLFWVVRTANDLLLAEDLMFPLPSNVRATFYVSHARTGGVVICRRSCDSVTYVPGKPVMDEVVNTTRYLSVNSTSVGVLACGPPGLVLEAQCIHLDIAKMKKSR
ncbi:hypothetical protein, variant [Aphanomyces invadans]|uniref:DOMON domain-containing protein n=1 Tax=Aphanomyces invadans TaxID=157072 RepID=A0A024U8E5_9STRA|nr:hypothetical protein, variant [Aphanomyces invadans]ETW02539.1 hypothetical protein, variant [Aphanomyces invadans]|eukprot:XP_008869144.1 hypothetical protein, variant [Aphanomyces invadans]